MSKMVYIKDICATTFLHYSPDGEGFALRDFSPPGGIEARVIKRQAPPEFTASRIEQLANVLGNFIIEINGQGQSVKNYPFWHDITLQLNREHDIGLDRRPLVQQPLATSEIDTRAGTTVVNIHPPKPEPLKPHAVILKAVGAVAIGLIIAWIVYLLKWNK